MPVCPAIVADTLARDVLASTDCLIAGQVEQSYASLLAPGGSLATALTIALTIYVAVFGYRLLLGLSSLSLSEVVPHLVKIGLVVALATSWPSYQALVFRALFDGPAQLGDLIVRQAAGGTGSDVMAGVQAIFDRLVDTAGDAWQQAAPATQPPVAAPPLQLGAPQFVAALLWLCALVLMAASVGVLLVARIVLALLLLLGPVFIAFALFRATRGLAEGWLRVTVKFALLPLFALPLIAVAVTILAPLVAGLGDTPVTGVRDTPALLVLLVVLVFAAVMVQAARLGGGIAGGIRLPRGGAVPVRTPDAVPGPVPTPVGGLSGSRTETIVQAVTAAAQRGATGLAGTAGAANLAVRTIAAPVGQAAGPPDSSNRLGQSYRRLAVGPTMRRGG